MMSTKACKHHARAGADINIRIAAALLFAGALLAIFGWTGESWAQAKTARIGILASQLTGTTDDATRQAYESFRRTLAEYGWVEGKNLSIEYRRPRGDPPQFAEGAAELVRLKVDVIYADSAPALRASFAATRTIPTVGLDFTNDPVAAGYAQSYGRPGGNVTGLFLDAPEFSGKWLELLKAIVPGLSRVVVLWDPNPGTAHLQGVQKVAPSFHVQLQILEVRRPGEIDLAFSKFRGQPQVVLVLPSPMNYQYSPQLASLTMKHRLPGIAMARQFAEAGGVLSYGPDLPSAHERCGALVARILGGAKPADLPVERPAKFNLLVNVKTAKSLGLTLPDSVRLRADELIR